MQPGWTRVLVALVAVGAVAVSAACSEPSGKKDGDREISAEQLKSVLVPLSEQPATSLAKGPITLREAATMPPFLPAPGVVFEPSVCATYLTDVLGPLESLEGWAQYGTRTTKDRTDNFLQVAVKVPGGADAKLIERIRAEVGRCKTGTLTLNGKVSGRITYDERTAVAVPDATTFAVTGTTRFAEPPTSADGQLVQNFEIPPGGQRLFDDEQAAVANVSFAASGDTLLIVHEAQPALADELLADMGRQLRALK